VLEQGGKGVKGVERDALQRRGFDRGGNRCQAGCGFG
jgi:hypothetical protein